MVGDFLSICPTVMYNWPLLTQKVRNLGSLCCHIVRNNSWHRVSDFSDHSNKSLLYNPMLTIHSYDFYTAVLESWCLLILMAFFFFGGTCCSFLYQLRKHNDNLRMNNVYYEFTYQYFLIHIVVTFTVYSHDQIPCLY